MKRLLAILLGVVLCAQPVLAQGNAEAATIEMTSETTSEGTEDATGTAEEMTIEETTKETTGETTGEAAEEAASVELSAPSAILMEASTGQIIYEKDADSKRPPASVTKIMTLLLIFDALEAGKIKLEDEVTTSEYAASMGGSQVYLEPGEVQTVETLIKCISVASANDACVTMAEYICGSEEEFVSQMNQRAEGLGMANTHFINCNGLDADGHLTTARDIALMSRELITKYPQIRDYCMIWQENIIHTTKKGSTEFGLTNTNKLVRHYEYATGLKTGSTSQAKFCISATAEKDGTELIAVIMAADDSKTRNADAVKLLSYGFGKCNKYEEETAPTVEPVAVKRGVEKVVKAKQKSSFAYVDTTGANVSAIERKVEIQEDIKAPIKKGQKLGEAKYYLDGKELGRVDIVAAEDMKEITYGSALKDVLSYFFGLS
ncbi:MAG: D-alanyl-D-alanine carboxypeptidase [Tyzzerella sp.]|nr:D-alanyl-D-alanine carboxypeptidase [Tyzzerella sp.]